MEKTLKKIIITGMIGLSGCGVNNERIRPENFSEPYAYYVTAFDDSKVLVVADTTYKGTLHKVDEEGRPVLTKETNYFKFFRDKSHNGFADSMGEMLYWEDGTSFRIREEDVPDSTYNLEEIRRKYNKN